MSGNSQSQSNAHVDTKAADGGNSTTTEAPKKDGAAAAAPNASATTPVEGDKKPGAEGDKKPEGKTEGVPEKYDFKVPDGIKLEESVTAELHTLAKEMGLPQEKAQKLVDLGVKHSQVLAKKQAEAWDKIREGWVTEIKGDKEFGGDKFGETVERATRTLRKFGSPTFAEFIETVGFGDNPELIKFLVRVDRGTSEDKVVDGKPSRESEKSAAETIYGSK